MYACMFVCMYVRTYVRMYVYMYVYVCMFTCSAYIPTFSFNDSKCAFKYTQFSICVTRTETNAVRCKRSLKQNVNKYY